MRSLVVLTAAVLLPLPAAAQTAPTIELESVEASAGDGRVIQGERGLLTVPLVRNDPGSRTIEIEVHRFPALNGRGDTPPVVLLHGGPGWVGLGPSLQRENYVRDIILRYVEVTDLVVVGQRGIGSSPPNTTCSAVRRPSGDVSRPPEDSEERVLEALAQCRRTWEDQGYDLLGFNVVEAAADVNDVRRALGYDRITLWGVSFGSHWSMAVMRFHPEIVARAVLSGMEGPDHTYDSPSGVLFAIEQLAASAEQSPDLAPFIPDGGLIEGLRSTTRAFEAEPVTVPVELRGETREITLFADDVRGAALGYSRRASSRSGMETWPSDMIRIIGGDWADFAQTVARQRAFSPSLPTASFWNLDCGSGITPERHARFAADPAQEIVGDPGAFYDLGCQAWDADLGDDFRQNFTTEIPTLIVHGEWDTSTPLSNAKELLPFFPNSTFVSVEGGSHGALNEIIREFPEMKRRIMGFVATGDRTGFPERVTLPPIDFVVPEGN